MNSKEKRHTHNRYDTYRSSPLLDLRTYLFVSLVRDVSSGLFNEKGERSVYTRANCAITQSKDDTSKYATSTGHQCLQFHGTDAEWREGNMENHDLFFKLLYKSVQTLNG